MMPTTNQHPKTKLPNSTALTIKGNSILIYNNKIARQRYMAGRAILGNILSGTQIGKV